MHTSGSMNSAGRRAPSACRAAIAPSAAAALAIAAVVAIALPVRGRARAERGIADWLVDMLDEERKNGG